MKKKYWYNAANVLFMLLTVGIFIKVYSNVHALFEHCNFKYIVVLVLAVVMVHAIKAGRLYLALYGAGIGPSSYIKTYCKVTPVSVVIPFKIGEFFRMFCYGTQLDNLLKGGVVVLLDRFMDTAALVTIVLMIWIFNGGQLAVLTYVLLLFLISVFLIYTTFPGMYNFWKGYFLRAKATEHKLTALRLLKSFDVLYAEVTTTTKGRGVILYFMSLIAWGVEIGCIALLCGLNNETHLIKTINDYLSSALGNGASNELTQFIFVSVIFMIVVYTCIECYEKFFGKKEA